MSDKTWETISFDCPPELFERIEERVDEALVHENRSQFLRTCIRKELKEDEDEFSESR